MKMTGMFRIALLPEANEKKFIDHMQGKVFGVLQLTRVTRVREAIAEFGLLIGIDSFLNLHDQ